MHAVDFDFFAGARECHWVSADGLGPMTSYGARVLSAASMV